MKYQRIRLPVRPDDKSNLDRGNLEKKFAVAFRKYFAGGLSHELCEQAIAVACDGSDLLVVFEPEMADIAIQQTEVDVNGGAGPGLFVAAPGHSVERCVSHRGLFGQRNEVGNRERLPRRKLRTCGIDQRKAFIGATTQLDHRRLLHGQCPVEIDRAAIEEARYLRKAQPHSLERKYLV